MNRESVFVTGISGSVGHYLFDYLSEREDIELYLLVRNARKLKFQYKDKPQVQIIFSDMENIDKYADLLEQMNYVIHLAASWGGPSVYDVNVDKTLKMFSYLNPQRLKKVIYFSTASILENDGSLSLAALRWGTDYIRSKYQCFSRLSGVPIHDKICTFFPTVLLGGDHCHPPTHASLELNKLWKYLPLLRFFKIDGSFHFIHAGSVARMIDYCLYNSCPQNKYILGNSPLTVDECLRQLCEIAGIKRSFGLDMTKLLAKFLPVILRGKMSSWDRYALSRRSFRFDTVNAKTFGLKPYREALKECLPDDLELRP